LDIFIFVHFGNFDPDFILRFFQENPLNQDFVFIQQILKKSPYNFIEEKPNCAGLPLFCPFSMYKLPLQNRGDFL
jgi:hypothetical protein